MTTHAYATRLTWSGSTAVGYDAYGRTHTVVPAGTPPLTLSSDPAFRGDPGLPNPEQLLLAAASSCQLLSFLAVAARSRVDVVGYHDDATATMPEGERPTRITEIVLHPRITVRGADPLRVRRLIDLAHDQCYVANSLTTTIRIEPTIEVLD